MGSCDVCAKNPCHRLHGLFQPLLVPTSPWFSISMDFIVDLSQSNSFYSILVVAVDHLRKIVHFIPYNKSIIGKNTTMLFFDHVFHYHGLLKNIISDYGPHFTSKFWKWVFKLLGVKVKLSLTFHPWTNGQTGQINQVLEQYL